MQGILINFVSLLFRVIEIIIILECAFSWFSLDNTSGIMAILATFTEPILKPFRIIQNKLLGDIPVDISPIFAIIVFDILKMIIIKFILGVF